MGRSIPAWTCPCGWVGSKSELNKHMRTCRIAKSNIKRDLKFKKMLGLR